MSNLFPEITEAVMMALTTLKSDVLACMRSPAETAEIVTFLQQHGFAAQGTASAQEMLTRTMIDNPYLLIFAEECSWVGERHLVAHIWEWNDNDLFDPAVLEAVSLARFNNDIVHTRGIYMQLPHPLNKQDLLRCVTRGVTSAEAIRTSDFSRDEGYKL